MKIVSNTTHSAVILMPELRRLFEGFCLPGNATVDFSFLASKKDLTIEKIMSGDGVVAQIIWTEHKEEDKPRVMASR